MHIHNRGQEGGQLTKDVLGGVTPDLAPSLTLDSSIVLANPFAAGIDPR
jgi:hypothetical protein